METTKSGRRWWRTGGWLLLGLAVIVGGFHWLLNSLTWDNRAPIEKALLINSNGNLNDVAVTGALSARFPPGTPAQSLDIFVKALGGHCHASGSTIDCEVDVQGVVCAASGLNISSSINPAGNLGLIVARSFSKTC